MYTSTLSSIFKVSEETSMRRMAANVKGKVSKMVVRRAMMYGLEMLALRKIYILDNRMFTMELAGKRKRGHP